MKLPSLYGNFEFLFNFQREKENILSVEQAANEAGVAASKLLAASTGLSSQSEQLKAEVNGFLGSIRAA